MEADNWKCFVVCFALLLSVGNCRKHVADCDHIPAAEINTAYLTISTGQVTKNVTLRGISAECHTCHLQPIMKITTKYDNCTILVDTRWTMHLEIVDTEGITPLTGCSRPHLDLHFKEGGKYAIYLRHNKSGFLCTKPVLLYSPSDKHIPIFVAMGIFAAMALLWIGSKRLYRSRFVHRLRLRFSTESAAFVEPDLGTPTNVVNEEEKRPKRERLKSLDTFRGLCLVVMCFVNYGGGGYWFLDHSDWNGITVADTVFPWFVWIMGTAMAYSYQSLLRRATPKRQIFWKILKRTCILFMLGLLINCSGISPPHMKTFRIPGVLQRFAGTYLIVATTHMFFAKQSDPRQYTRWSFIRDMTNYVWEWVFYLALVAVWLFLTFLLHVPGCPTGYLGPGGLAHDAPGHNVTDCTGGAAAYIDRKIFGIGHIYQTPTCKEIYDTTMPHDPEGLLGTLMSCFICFLGLQAGKIMLVFHDFKARVRRFLVWGVILGLLGTLLCKGEKDGGWIPLNKNLWSLSFVLVLAATAFILLSFCYLTIDVYKVWSGAPFYYPGMNSIFMYVSHIVLQNFFPVQIYVDETSHAQQLAIHLWGPILWCLITYKMHVDKLYFSI